MSIKQEWCVYGYLSAGTPSGYGQIVEDSKGSVFIKYAENQMYAAECWDDNYVKRFDKLEEAVEYYIKNGFNSPRNLEVEIRQAYSHFPSYKKKVKKT